MGAMPEGAMPEGSHAGGEPCRKEGSHAGRRGAMPETMMLVVQSIVLETRSRSHRYRWNAEVKGGIEPHSDMHASSFSEPRSRSHLYRWNAEVKGGIEPHSDMHASSCSTIQNPPRTEVKGGI